MRKFVILFILLNWVLLALAFCGCSGPSLERLKSVSSNGSITCYKSGEITYPVSKRAPVNHEDGCFLEMKLPERAF
jgi:hypothetical protein